MPAVTLAFRPQDAAVTPPRIASPASRPDLKTLTLQDEDVCIDGREVDGCIYCTGPETD